MARVINQNKEVIATKGNDKATVSKTSLIVGIALSVAAIVILVVIILFLTRSNKEDKDSNTTPLLQYIDNYKGSKKNENKIQLLTGFYVKDELEKFNGECYILVYDTTWMKTNEAGSVTYKAYETVDSYLTGCTRSDGKSAPTDPLLKAIENCGQDIKFFVIDFESVKKSEEDAQKNPVYFTMKNGAVFSDNKAPSLYHYDGSKTYKNISELLIADGSVDSDGKPNYPAAYWGSLIIHEVNYLNSIDTKTDDED